MEIEIKAGNGQGAIGDRERREKFHVPSSKEREKW
jgi:hypothetical protein